MTRLMAEKNRMPTVEDGPGQLIERFLSENLAAAVAELRKRVWEEGDGVDLLDAIYDRIKRLRRLRAAVQSLAQSAAGDARHPCYLVAASFLREAFEALTKSPEEHLVYATGPEDGERLFALTRLVTFDLQVKSVANAAPEPGSQIRALARLDSSKERLLATLHSHPGRGAGATEPSCVDLATQEGLERLGYPTIGVIFSRSGHARFYGVNRAFRIAVSGAGIEQLEERLFRLTDVKKRSTFAGTLR